MTEAKWSTLNSFDQVRKAKNKIKNAAKMTTEARNNLIDLTMTHLPLSARSFDLISTWAFCTVLLKTKCLSKIKYLAVWLKHHNKISGMIISLHSSKSFTDRKQVRFTIKGVRPQTDLIWVNNNKIYLENLLYHINAKNPKKLQYDREVDLLTDFLYCRPWSNTQIQKAVVSLYKRNSLFHNIYRHINHP